MQDLSKRMLAAGWVLHSQSENSWEVISPHNRTFRWESGDWNPGREAMLAELERCEKEILLSEYSPFTGTSRLTVNSKNPTPGLLTQWLCRHESISGSTILRVRAEKDPAGDEELYAAGARRVETLLQPWPPAPNTQRHIPFHLMICEHVADVLPQKDRNRTLPRLQSHLAADATAYFSFYQMDALPLSRPHRSAGDGYIFAHGPHEVFMKPSLPGQCAAGLQKIIGGFAEEVDLLYNEIICRWSPHEI